MKDESLMKFELRDGVVSIGANLSKRELFAALAMQGILANEKAMANILYECGRANDVMHATVLRSCEYADALLAELAKGGG